MSSNETLPGRGWARLLVRSSGCRGSRALSGLAIAGGRLRASSPWAEPPGCGKSFPDGGALLLHPFIVPPWHPHGWWGRTAPGSYKPLVSSCCSASGCHRNVPGHPAGTLVKGIPWILPELLLDWRQLCSCCNFLGGIVWICWLLSFFFSELVCQNDASNSKASRALGAGA